MAFTLAAGAFAEFWKLMTASRSGASPRAAGIVGVAAKPTTASTAETASSRYKNERMPWKLLTVAQPLAVQPAMADTGHGGNRPSIFVVIGRTFESRTVPHRGEWGRNSPSDACPLLGAFGASGQ